MTSSCENTASDRPSNRPSRLALSAAALLTFALVLVARWEVVDSPPYFDAANALWREAEFLARTNFNYWSLRYEHDTGINESGTGGPRIYMTSVLPTAMALLFRAFPGSIAPIVIYHLAVFFAAAWVAVLLFELLRPRIGGLLAGLAAAAASTTPVYCVQIDMLAFETFLALAALVWIVQVDRGRFLAAAAASFAAFLVKPTGMIFTIALLSYLGLRILADLAAYRRVAVRWLVAAAVCGGVLALERFLVVWGGALGYQFAGRLSLWMALAWFPDVLLLAAAAVLLLAAAGVRWSLGHWARPADAWERFARARRAAADFVDREAAYCCAAAAAAGVALGMSNVRFVPRYAAVAVPLLYFLVGVSLSWWTTRRRAPAVALAAIVAVNLVNWNGVLLPDQGESLERLARVHRRILEREGSLLERSHEYLANHRENLAATRAVLKAAKGRPIVTSAPFSTYLTYPEFGVVKRPVPVYSTFNMGGAISGMKETADLIRDRPEEFVCLRDASTWFTAHAVMEIPAPEKDDVLLYGAGPRDGLLAFEKKFPPGGGRDWDRWIARGKSFPALTASILWSAYAREGATNVFFHARQAIEREAIEGEMYAVLAAAGARIGLWDQALTALLKAEARLGVLARGTEDEIPRHAKDALGRSLDALAEGDSADAVQWAVAAVLADAPPIAAFVDAYRRGLARLDAGDVPLASEYFRTLLRADRAFWPAKVGLAKVRWREGDWSQAKKLLQQVLRDEPSAEEPHRLMALLLAREGRSNEAAELLNAYLAKRPTSPLVEECLEELSNASVAVH
jgi:tetratricopeptide (TPR) repeat protein